MLNKIASAPTQDRLTEMLKKFYFSENIRIEDGKVFNSKGMINGVTVTEKKGRFTAAMN